jgi:hypothetical protein
MGSKGQAFTNHLSELVNYDTMPFFVFTQGVANNFTWVVETASRKNPGRN